MREPLYFPLYIYMYKLKNNQKCHTKKKLSVFSAGENYGFLPRRTERNLSGCYVRGILGKKIPGKLNFWREVEHVSAEPHFCF